MNSISILVVEDELIIAKNIAKKLRSFGYTVPKIVSSGQAAIEWVKREPPHLVLMDIAIRGEMDGIETAKEIKGITDIPFIFLTAYANDEIIERASRSGAYGYLIKPIRDKELQATIQMALNKHQEQSSIQYTLQSTVNEYSLQYDNIYKNSLTNLPNQLFIRDLYDYFSALLKSEIAGELNQLKLVAVFNIYLDRFKKIDSCLNKEQQDKFIQTIVERLNNCIPEQEFQNVLIYLDRNNYAILSALDKKQTACNYGHKIIRELTKAFYIDNLEIFLLPSVGIAFNPLDSENIEELLEQSQKAREYAQRQGGNRCQLFTFAFNIKNSRAAETLTMESYLHHALEKQELELYYQPQISLQDNTIVGAEALIRWNHPLLGRLTADKFIPLAEESGLIRPISQWVLDSACQQIKIWHDYGLDFLKLGINISGFQFRQSDLFHQMTQTLFNTSLDPQFLVLELTEKILVENIKTNIQRLNLLKKLGVKLALDDFGTGYSSLSYLQKFSFDILKIDPCFIRNLDVNNINQIITKNTIDLAHQLNLTVIAEGVETETELKCLRKYQCDEIQGFLYSRPLPALEFQKLALEQKKLANKIGNKTQV